MMNATIEYTPNLGARWYGYIGIDDVAARASRAQELGGTLIAGPENIPGVGGVCLLAEPTGALIRLMQPAK
jgi:predicted enzyme related to lactoylglutathione lyase